MEKVYKLTYSVKEMATALGISIPKGYELVNSSGFPVVRIGSRIRIPIAALEQWLEAQAAERAQLAVKDS